MKYFPLKNYVISILRRASYKYRPRSEVLTESRVGRNQYKCVMCPNETVHPRSNVQVDHINPVIGEEGFTTFDNFIMNLFCEKKGLQVLCREHHKEKTNKENVGRKKYSTKE